VFTVPIRVRNWANRYLDPEEHGEDIEIDAVVDSGAVQTALSADLVETLKLTQVDEIRARTADGALHTYRLMGIAEVEVQGRSWRGQVIELPRGTRPLLGAVTLEEMDWHISPAEQKLLPSPESPDRPEILLLELGADR
jgi:clan AA aspartic protease